MNDTVIKSSAVQAAVAVESGWKKYLYGLVAGEISLFTRYYDELIEIRPASRDTSILFDRIDCPNKRGLDEASVESSLLDLSGRIERRTAILLNGTMNHSFDIQKQLLALRPKMGRTSRLVVVAYNSYLSGIYRLATRLGLRKGPEGSTFLTVDAIQNILRISGFELVRIKPSAYFPFRLLGIGSLINRFMAAVPLFRWFGAVSVLVARPAMGEVSGRRPSLSIVIPARNEKGNIENALKRMPDLGCELEIIFVEGHSKDQTWEEIQRVVQAYSGGRFKLQAHRQTGKGKNDAVRLGFSKATGDLLTILDADLTMPPELLGRFYDAYVQGYGDFVNGNRLVYPMEGNAMRFLNRLGNLFFAKALSFVLDCRLGDSLCGTKFLARHDYRRIVAWRSDFGDFDPFGDFELLFPASILGLGVVDMPIRYLDRTYGTTNISRFRHGAMLLRMTLIGLFRIRMGRA